MAKEKVHDPWKVPFDGMKVFTGRDGVSYLVFRTPDGSFHAYKEVEAKYAALECGSTKDPADHTNAHWADLWRQK